MEIGVVTRNAGGLHGIEIDGASAANPDSKPIQQVVVHAEITTAEKPRRAAIDVTMKLADTAEWAHQVRAGADG